MLHIRRRGVGVLGRGDAWQSGGGKINSTQITFWIPMMELLGQIGEYKPLCKLYMPLNARYLVGR